VSGVGRRMAILDWGGDRRRGRSVLTVNLERPIVTNGDGGDELFPNYFGEDLFNVCHELVVSTHLHNTIVLAR